VVARHPGDDQEQDDDDAQEAADQFDRGADIRLPLAQQHADQRRHDQHHQHLRHVAGGHGVLGRQADQFE
jgi:hypothetical protein